MVKIALQIKVTFENIQELRTCREKFRWYLRFVCSNCGEKTEKWSYISLSETVPASKGHALNHLLYKCKLCSRENSLTIINDSLKPYTADDQGDFKTIVVFDCRGIEPYDFSPREGWIAKAIDDGKEFTDIDLSEGDWADYCEKINKPVGIYEVDFRLERVK